MALKDEIRLSKILGSKTILTPNQQFKYLGLNNADFITFNELCDISRKESLAKLYALRDICNHDRNKGDFNYITKIAYQERTRPVLTLLFQQCAVSDFSITETFTIPNGTFEDNDEKNKDNEDNEEKNKNNKEKKSKDKTVPAYSINSDILDYLLNTAFLRSKLDLHLVEKHRELLELFQEYIQNGPFYPDFHVYDSTGNILISSKHENFIANMDNDSILFPQGFGEINAYHQGLLVNLDSTYNPITEEIKTFVNYPDNVIGERVFIHKALLPRAYSNTEK